MACSVELDVMIVVEFSLISPSISFFNFEAVVALLSIQRVSLIPPCQCVFSPKTRAYMLSWFGCIVPILLAIMLTEDFGLP